MLCSLHLSTLEILINTFLKYISNLFQNINIDGFMIIFTITN